MTSAAPNDRRNACSPSLPVSAVTLYPSLLRQLTARLPTPPVAPVTIDRSASRLQPVVLQFDDRQGGGEPGCANRHRLEEVQARGQRHHPVGRHTRDCRVAAVVRHAEIVAGDHDGLALAKTAVGRRSDGAGEVDAADEREPAQDLSGPRSRQRVLVVDAGIGDVDDDVAWREFVDRSRRRRGRGFCRRRCETRETSSSERIRPDLEVHHLARRALAGLHVEWRARRNRGPQTAPLPSALRDRRCVHPSTCCRSPADTARASRPTCRP